MPLIALFNFFSGIFGAICTPEPIVLTFSFINKLTQLSHINSNKSTNLS